MKIICINAESIVKTFVKKILCFWTHIDLYKNCNLELPIYF